MLPVKYLTLLELKDPFFVKLMLFIDGEPAYMYIWDAEAWANMND